MSSNSSGTMNNTILQNKTMSVIWNRIFNINTFFLFIFTFFAVVILTCLIFLSVQNEQIEELSKNIINIQIQVNSINKNFIDLIKNKSEILEFKKLTENASVSLAQQGVYLTIKTAFTVLISLYWIFNALLDESDPNISDNDRRYIYLRSGNTAPTVLSTYCESDEDDKDV
jgi:hypothetical protein